eukprot:scaffold5337_cov167-Amphora_coffeaeformis.AAC.12
MSKNAKQQVQTLQSTRKMLCHSLFGKHVTAVTAPNAESLGTNFDSRIRRHTENRFLPLHVASHSRGVTSPDAPIWERRCGRN